VRRCRNHGYIDLFVTASGGENVLYRNQGNGTFRDEPEASDSSRQSRVEHGCGASSTLIGSFLIGGGFVRSRCRLGPRPYAARPEINRSVSGKEYLVLCGPRGLPGETVPLQEDGHGHFTMFRTRCTSQAKNFYGLTKLTGDFDNDDGLISTWPVIPRRALFQQSRGQEIRGDRRSVGYSPTNEEREGTGGHGSNCSLRYWKRALWTFFKTNFADGATTHLYKTSAENRLSERRFLPVSRLTPSTWGGNRFLDIDNDGWKGPDIVANGQCIPKWKRCTGENFKQSRLLYWNRRDGQSCSSPRSAYRHFRRHSSRACIGIWTMTRIELSCQHE